MPLFDVQPKVGNHFSIQTATHRRTRTMLNVLPRQTAAGKSRIRPHLPSPASVPCSALLRRRFSLVLHQPLTSHAGRWGCGCNRSRSRSSRTRCTCSRRGHGDACASGNGCTPSRRTTSRTTRSASRRHDARASSSGCECNPNHSSQNRNVDISYSFIPLFWRHYIMNPPR